LDTPESLLDNSNLLDNSWFTGFTESDGHFRINYIERKTKSDTRKRSVSESVTLRFILGQRLFDKPTSSSMKPFMEDLALFLSCNLKSYTNNKNSEILTVSVSSLDSVIYLVNYFPSAQQPQSSRRCLEDAEELFFLHISWYIKKKLGNKYPLIGIN
jgi:hypothetical protein